MAVRRSELGMTLIEMLVVLAIVGIAAGAVALGIGSAERGGRVESEARQLAARLRLAADEAMVTDHRLVFVHDERGYAFVQPDEADAYAGTKREAFARHDLPSGMTLDAGQRVAVPIGVDGAGEAIDARISGGGDAWTVAWDGLNVAVASAGAL